MTDYPAQWSLTSLDSCHRWKDCITELIRQKKLDRSRIVQSCLDAFGGEFTDFQCRWFVQLLERIKLEDELATDDKRLSELFSHPNPSVKTLAFKTVEIMYQQGRIGNRFMLTAIPNMLSGSKKQAKKGLSILQRLVKNEPDLRNEVLALLLSGLRREEAEIQQASLDILKRLGNVSHSHMKSELERLAPQLAPSVQKALSELIGIKSHETVMSETEEQKSSTTTKMVISTDDKQSSFVREPFQPVTTFDELLQLAYTLIDRPEDVDDMERFMDGMARIGYDKPIDFIDKTSALLLATLKQFGNLTRKIGGDLVYILLKPGPFTGCDVQQDFRYVVTAWITGEIPVLPELNLQKKEEERERMAIADRQYIPTYMSPGIPALQLFSRRMKEIATIVAANRSVQLLATPTYRYSWLDPVVFVQRLIESCSNKIEHDEHDRVLALLRLTPENRDTALKLLDNTITDRNEYLDAVRYALGANNVKPGSTPYYWIAAARCRNPLADDPEIEKVFPNYGPDGATAAKYVLRVGPHEIYSDRSMFFIDSIPHTAVEGLDMTLYPTIGLHQAVDFVQGEDPGVYPWLLAIWPQNPDPAIATALDTHTVNLDNSGTDAGFRHSLAAIARPGTRIHSIAISALFTGLAMKCSVVSITATDTLISLIGDGRMTIESTVDPVCELVQSGILTLTRWVKPLQAIANQSACHVTFVKALLEHIVGRISSKELGGFLELLHELCTVSGEPIETEACRDFLGKITGSGKAAKLAKKLLSHS